MLENITLSFMHDRRIGSLLVNTLPCTPINWAGDWAPHPKYPKSTQTHAHG